jgi:Apea-like HEPN
VTLILRPEIREQLINKLSDILSWVQVSNNWFPDHRVFSELAELEERLQKNAQFWERCDEFISDRPLADFFLEVLTDELKSSQKYDLATNKMPLSSFAEYRDTKAVAERLIKDFESLPREYECFVKLPLINLQEVLGEKQYVLSESLSLIFTDEQHNRTFPAAPFDPPTREFKLFFFGPKDEEHKLNWLDYFPYFQVSVSGFIGGWEETSPLRRVSFLIRSFCGLALALRLIETTFLTWPIEAYLAVYEKCESQWAPKKARTLPTGLVQGLERLRLHDRFSSSPMAKRSFKGVLEKLRLLFQGEKQNEKLLLAAQWYFDSYCGDSDLLAFVKATICLEILLGDKKLTDIIGLGKLMSNRCAYLISTTQKERDEVLAQFDGIYKTRSSIVHSGKDRLTNTERETLFTLRLLCSRVLRKEIELC